MRHAEVTLDDKFLLTEGRVFITGVQALLRVLMDQQRLDAAAGLSTAGFVSGYRGSPAGVQEVLDYGLLGYAMSRYSGLWVGLIALADTMDSGATIDVSLARHAF